MCIRDRYDGASDYREKLEQEKSKLPANLDEDDRTRTVSYTHLKGVKAGGNAIGLMDSNTLPQTFKEWANLSYKGEFLSLIHI